MGVFMCVCVWVCGGGIFALGEFFWLEVFACIVCPCEERCVAF